MLVTQGFKYRIWFYDVIMVSGDTYGPTRTRAPCMGNSGCVFLTVLKSRSSCFPRTSLLSSNQEPACVAALTLELMMISLKKKRPSNMPITKKTTKK